MKKLNLFFLIVLSSLCFCGCKSTPPETNINPLELLDNKSQYYFRIPVSVDPVLVDRVLKANVSSLSDSDSKLIVSRINTIYAGYTRRRNSVEFQISSDCSFPKSITSKVFTKKNGFEARKLNLNNAEPETTPYDVYFTAVSARQKAYAVQEQNTILSSLSMTLKCPLHWKTSR